MNMVAIIASFEHYFRLLLNKKGSTYPSAGVLKFTSPKGEVLLPSHCAHEICGIDSRT